MKGRTELLVNIDREQLNDRIYRWGIALFVICGLIWLPY